MREIGVPACSNQLVVIFVTPDPHPFNGVANKMRYRSMVITYPHGKTCASAAFELLEIERSMAVIAFPKLISFSRAGLNRRRKRIMKASKSGPYILISLARGPVSQFASRPFALSFLEKKIKFSRRRVLLHQLLPRRIVLFSNKGRQFRQFFCRKLTHRTLDLGQAHVAILTAHRAHFNFWIRSLYRRTDRLAG